MKPTEQLQNLGQSIWLDNISCELIDNDNLRRYIENISMTGSTSNPSIFDVAIGTGYVYDAGIDIKALAIQLQHDGAQAFVKSWQQLLQRIADKSAALSGKTITTEELKQ